MVSKLSGVGDALFKLGEKRRALQTDALNQAVKMAELQQAGYDIQRQPGRFGGFGSMTITPRPGYTSTADIDRQLKEQKLQDYLDPSREAKRFGMMMQEMQNYMPQSSPSAGQSGSYDYEGQPAEGYLEGDMVDDVDEAGNVTASYEVVGGVFRRVS